jgi:hypothetical protein
LTSIVKGEPFLHDPLVNEFTDDRLDQCGMHFRRGPAWLVFAGSSAGGVSARQFQDTVNVVAAMIATLAALVLGLLVGSAKSSFDGTNTAVIENGARAVLLDRALAAYGPGLSY